MSVQFQVCSSRRAIAFYTRRTFKPGRVYPQGRQFTTTNPRQVVPSPDPPSLGLAASIILGLPLALWTYKCLFLILVQRKLIYMGYVPPGSREEDLTMYKDLLHGIGVEQIRLKNMNDNCLLHGIVVRNSDRPKKLSGGPRIILIYLQGNAGNPLHRLPVFKTLLNACSDLEPIIVAIAPRSYWRSTRHTPTEEGLLSDYGQVVEYACTRWPTEPVFLLGHSLGASVGTCLASRMSDSARIRGLILENPFSSIPDMIQVLYPSRWLPYHYLGHFAWDKWDAVHATREARESSVLGRLLREKGLLILQSEKDELVPLSMGREIWNSGKVIQRLVVIRGALHENAWESREWSSSIHKYLTSRLEN